jgi:hypothetical protein
MKGREQQRERDFRENTPHSPPISPWGIPPSASLTPETARRWALSKGSQNWRLRDILVAFKRVKTQYEMLWSQNLTLTRLLD